MADLVQLVLDHRRMTAQAIPAMAAYTGSHNDLSVPGCSPGQSTSLAHLTADTCAWRGPEPITPRDQPSRILERWWVLGFGP